MEFAVLGPLEVRGRGRPISVPSVRQRMLLALLLLDANRVVSCERLVEALWAGKPPDHADKVLEVHVTQLRKTLADDDAPAPIVTRPPGYVIEVDASHFDLAEFERLVRDGRDAWAAGDAVRAARALTEAETLWRGPALADLVDEPALREERERLDERRLAVLEERIEAELALGRHGELVAELEALVNGNPLRERLRAQLMLALYRLGRRGEALETYQSARRALVDELGIEPTPALQLLEKSILRQDPEFDAAAPVPPSRPMRAIATSTGTATSDVERKLVTLLFADLVESTALGAEEDPERLRLLLERFYDAAAEEISAVGGTVEKFAGDAVMAAFGAPIAQEDHAERALHAAIALRDRVGELLGSTDAVRIGVNTGEAVVGRAREGSSFVTGDAVNVAARLEQAAAPGEILVGARTAAAVEGAFELDATRTVEAKGKPGGVQAQRLVCAVARERPRGIRGIRRTFVSRERELASLEHAYRRTVDDGVPRLVTVLGDAGVGKTSLVSEFSERLSAERPEPVRLTGRCLPYGQETTYRPLADVLRAHLGLLDSDSATAVRKRLGENQILGLTLGLDVGEPHPVVAQERLHEAWVELLERLARDRPALVVVEDLHWAQKPLLDLLERLARDVEGPLLLLATARPDLADRRTGWSVGRRAESVWLEPLSRAEAERMLEEMLGAELPERMRDLVDQAEGNPFFVEELVASLIEQGVLARPEGGWQLTAPVESLAVPDSVQAVLAARIDFLDDADKAALQAGAVIGRAFWPRPVVELLEGAAPDFAVLEQRDFVRRRPRSSLAGEREYVFKHALTREVAYATLPKARRARLHAAFAAWLERESQEREEHATILAHHYAHAIRPEDADLAWAGRKGELALLREKALVWLRRASELAATRYALDEEVALLQQAIPLAATAREQAELWWTLARVCGLKYDRRGIEAAMLRAIELRPEPEFAGAAYSELAFQTLVRFSWTEDRERLSEWIESALELAPPDSRALGYALVARSYLLPDDAQSLAEEADAIATRLDDQELRSWAWYARADSALAAGDYDEAVRADERRLEILERVDDPDHRADAYWSMMPAFVGALRFDEARRLAALKDEVTQELTPHHRVHAIGMALEIEELAGDWERVRALTPRAERAVEANLASTCVHNPRSLLVCALASACLGDDAEAARLETLATAFDLEDQHGRVVETRIWLALVRDDLAAVERLVDAKEENPLLRVRKLAPVAARLDALGALGRREDVEREAPPLLRPRTYLEPFALRALGRVRDDADLLREAAARFAAAGLEWQAAQF